MPRTSEEIEEEIDAWLTTKAELQASMTGLKESLETLQAQLPEGGTSAKLAALTTQLGELREQYSEATREAQSLKARLEKLEPSPSPRPSPNPPAPAPRPADDPPAPPPPGGRRTRTGLDFL